MKSSTRAILLAAASMIIFGTVGVVRVQIAADSALIAAVRGLIGMLVLAPPAIAEHRRSPAAFANRRELAWLALSGAAIGVNWILLFEAMRFTSISVATLIYYMAPVFVTAASPFVLREKLTLRQALCAAAALLGMAAVSGVLRGGVAAGEAGGMLLALGAAALYASVVLMNKKITGVPPVTRTALQLGAAGLVALPYAAVTGGITAAAFSVQNCLWMLLAGVVHTGAAYLMYFSALPFLRAQTAALFSYLDPVTALVLSAAVLHERMDAFGWLGAALILGATLMSEIDLNIFKKNKKST